MEEMLRVLAPGEGRKVRFAGSETVFKITGDETGDRYEIHESGLVPGGGPPAHIHSDVIHAFFVLVGEVEFEIGGRKIALGPGGFVFCPAGVPHTFRNHGETEVRWLQVDSPGGRERMFQEMGEKVPVEPGPAQQRAMAEVLERYDTKVVPPS